ncbi:DUF1127 domain-containing protein [Rhodobium gokarnense]|uniref:Uncharacterized protein YjiS (DUF1127 family) n=1 Tax=Rhodobium gokarnense TaxID=364296 RepID=A0ABT3HFQ8_9HYPH|nr:DUF1127 domain-containing protein [Rhodobium gokarnense]MCW2309233.1 uncharacterized protein YjiS (DUF1127 family) [Rhodobium gokarnense]
MYLDQKILFHMEADTVSRMHGAKWAGPGNSHSRQANGPIRRKEARIRAVAAKIGPEKWIGRLIGLVVRWHDRRAAIRALERLSDYQLKDIGLGRADIPSIVAKGRTMRNGSW